MTTDVSEWNDGPSLLNSLSPHHQPQTTLAHWTPTLSIIELAEWPSIHGSFARKNLLMASLDKRVALGHGIY